MVVFNPLCPVRFTLLLYCIYFFSVPNKTISNFGKCGLFGFDIVRLSTDRSCDVPRTHNTFGDRSFAVAGPCVWNSLPAHLRDEYITYTSFRRELKTYTFAVAGARLWNSLPPDIVACDTLQRELKTFLFRQSHPSILISLVVLAV